jgi:Xaa-Pro aminopeptidase
VGTALRRDATESEADRATESAVPPGSRHGDWIRSACAFGPRGGLGHVEAVDNVRLRDGETAFQEVTGFAMRYGAHLIRTVARRPTPEVWRRYRAVRAAVDAGVALMADGNLAAAVSAACRAPLRDAGLEHLLLSRTGYGNGYESTLRGTPSIEPNSPTVLRKGMTFHLLVMLMDTELGSLALSETVIVGTHGGEVLSTMARDLIEI